ncbi:hypothetical protein SKAU_G00339440 [Synaphobranchus kaupii]|uniref:Uncharacterized protein n=1 Tax=Synaphobranchus kaupii TaxID=118154 RepID=A0A9Q1IH42_SYNKA|nr:hypothetical protein SKAU_G00339440 [Synaphobranchus kaupii]
MHTSRRRKPRCHNESQARDLPKDDRAPQMNPCDVPVEQMATKRPSPRCDAPKVVRERGGGVGSALTEPRHRKRIFRRAFAQPDRFGQNQTAPP